MHAGVHANVDLWLRDAEGEIIVKFDDAMEIVVCNTFFKPEE